MDLISIIFILYLFFLLFVGFKSLGFSKTQEDYFLALKTLGYGNDEIRSAISKSGNSLSTADSIESGIKIILKNIN